MHTRLERELEKGSHYNGSTWHTCSQNRSVDGRGNKTAHMSKTSARRKTAEITVQPGKLAVKQEVTTEVETRAVQLSEKKTESEATKITETQHICCQTGSHDRNGDKGCIHV